MIILNTQGIVLKAVRYKENDVILTLFTRKLGKVSAIAKGAKRNKSSLLSSAQLFSYANYTLKRKGNMYTVNQSDTIKSFYVHFIKQHAPFSAVRVIFILRF